MTDLSLSQLGQFTGTEAYHNIMGVQVTDGVAYIFENGYSWVVTDACVILKMHKKVKSQEFVTIDLKLKETHQAEIVYSDGNGKVLYKQKYKYTDAQREVKMYYQNGVLMLSGEY